MKKFNMITPEGTKDVLFEECIARRKTEKIIKEVFIKRAYNEVISPGVEFYDVFNLENAAIPQSELYKTTDNNGRLVVFRPEMTLPIARLAATRLKTHKGALRLFYNQAVYRNRKDFTGRSDECTQAGIELLGIDGLMADLEAITTAVEALKACNINFRLEIGHANIFRQLIQKLGIDDELKEKIRSTIESKNFASLNVIMKDIPSSVHSEAIKKLPALFGGEEVFEQANEFCTDDELKSTLDYLRTLYTALCKLELGDKIIIDLGLVQRNEYYSGMVFSAYTQGFGSAVLIGGRYDNILEKFNAPMPAVGFAINVDAVTEIAFPNEKTPKIDAIVFGRKGREIDAQLKINELTYKGFVCETSFFDTVDETKAYAKSKGIPKLIILDNGETEVFL